MSSSNIDQKIRRQAMLWILANLLPSAISLLFNSLLPMNSPIVGSLLTSFSAMALFCPLIIWLINRKSHPLISECTKESLNFTFSNYLYVTIVASIWIASCFGSFLTPSGFFTGVFAFSSHTLLLLGLFYICAIVFGSIQAARGNVYKYPLTIRFFR